MQIANNSMSLYNYLNRIRRLDTLIRQKCTGTPQELALRLNISERWLFVLLDELKNELNCPIEYDRKRRSYYYAENGRVYLQFMNEMEKEHMGIVSGGYSIRRLFPYHRLPYRPRSILKAFEFTVPTPTAENSS